jgi:hypothetical protein
MRNQLGSLSLCSLAVLSVWAVACANASFAPAPIADGGGGTDGTAAADDSGVEPDVEPDVSESCPEPNQPCSGSPATGICDPVCQHGGCAIGAKRSAATCLTAPPHSPPASATQGKGSSLLPARMQNNLIIAPREASVCRLPSGTPSHTASSFVSSPRIASAVWRAASAISRRSTFRSASAILPTIPAGGPAAIPWAASAVPLPGGFASWFPLTLTRTHSTAVPCAPRPTPARRKRPASPRERLNPVAAIGNAGPDSARTGSVATWPVGRPVWPAICPTPWVSVPRFRGGLHPTILRCAPPARPRLVGRTEPATARAPVAFGCRAPVASPVPVTGTAQLASSAATARAHALTPSRFPRLAHPTPAMRPPTVATLRAPAMPSARPDTSAWPAVAARAPTARTAQPGMVALPASVWTACAATPRALASVFRATRPDRWAAANPFLRT